MSLHVCPRWLELPLRCSQQLSSGSAPFRLYLEAWGMVARRRLGGGGHRGCRAYAVRRFSCPDLLLQLLLSLHVSARWWERWEEKPWPTSTAPQEVWNPHSTTPARKDLERMEVRRKGAEMFRMLRIVWSSQTFLARILHLNSLADLAPLDPRRNAKPFLYPTHQEPFSRTHFLLICTVSIC